jgi:hypothetical protein
MFVQCGKDRRGTGEPRERCCRTSERGAILGFGKLNHVRYPDARCRDLTMPKKRANVVAINPSGPDHQVVTVEGGNGTYRRMVCEECPWRIDQTGKFPPEAFRHSANTAYDQSMHQFACHMRGSVKPATCAGFLLRGATHNIAFRLAVATGKINPNELRETVPLHPSYRAMAEANGVQTDDPTLQRCRDA